MGHLKTIRFVLFLLFAANALNGQEQKPFWDDIQTFKKQDSIQSIPQHPILFVGSSSFTNWKDVQNYFPGYTIINRGFGGSTLLDQIVYVNDIVFTYNPKQIVIYCGENDIAASDTVTGEMVYKRFTTLYNLIRKKLPNVSIIFISLKPSPSRWHLRQKMITANNKIKGFLATQKKAIFIDVYHKMLGPDGAPLKEIFLEDNLHMNAKGYGIWQKELQSHLLK